MRPGIALLDEALCLRHASEGLLNLLDRVVLRVGEPLARILELDAEQHADLQAALAAAGNWQARLPLRTRVLDVILQGLPPGEHSAYTLTVLDRSAEQQERLELEEARSLAERTDRAKSEFLSHMSHELRTPLNAILGFAQLLKISATLDALQQDNVSEIEKAGNYLLSLINEILELSSIESGQLRLRAASFSLRTLAGECLALVEPLAADSGIRLRLSLQGDVNLQLDPLRVKQVLVNLLGNAIKYNRFGGDVVLHCFPTGNDSVRIECQDSGQGIAADDLATIFSPFARLSNGAAQLGGTGLGLVIARRLATRMQGRLGVFSIPGRGSVFWVDFPAPYGTQPEAANRHPPQQDCTLGVLRPGEYAGLHEALASLMTLRPHWRLCKLDTLDNCRTWAGSTGATLLAYPDALSDVEQVALTTEKNLKNLPRLVVNHLHETSDVAHCATALSMHSSVPELLALLDGFCPTADQ